MKQTIRYLGIIGDLIGSRELTPRDKAQQALQAALEQANRKHQASLASRFTVTLGDEFQGLLFLARGPKLVGTLGQKVAQRAKIALRGRWVRLERQVGENAWQWLRKGKPHCEQRLRPQGTHRVKPT